MLKRILKAVNDFAKGKPLKLRSPKWDSLRDNFLKQNSFCAACGSEEFLQVHHIKPFHLFPEEELNEKNLITLCEGKKNKCHFNIGHLGNWKTNNPEVVHDSEKFYQVIISKKNENN